MFSIRKVLATGTAAAVCALGSIVAAAPAHAADACRSDMQAAIAANQAAGADSGNGDEAGAAAEDRAAAADDTAALTDCQSYFQVAASPSVSPERSASGALAKPIIIQAAQEETTAATDAASTNQLDIEAGNTAQTAATLDNEAANTLLFG